MFFLSSFYKHKINIGQFFKKQSHYFDMHTILIFSIVHIMFIGKINYDKLKICKWKL